MASLTPAQVEEAEANIFAMYLLVPDTLLEKEPLIDLTDDNALARMAKRYKVPMGVMAARLGQFYEKRKTNAL